MPLYPQRLHLQKRIRIWPHLPPPLPSLWPEPSSFLFTLNIVIVCLCILPIISLPLGITVYPYLPPPPSPFSTISYTLFQITSLFWSESSNGSGFTQSKCQSADNGVQGLMWFDLCHPYDLNCYCHRHLFHPGSIYLPAVPWLCQTCFSCRVLSPEMYMVNSLTSFKSHLHCAFSKGSILTTLFKMQFVLHPPTQLPVFFSYYF